MSEATADALSEALLVQWATENKAIAEAQLTAGGSSEHHRSSLEAQSLGELRVLNLSQYSAWHEMPFELRMDTQPFCMHPRLLDVADVTVANSRAGCALPCMPPGADGTAEMASTVALFANS